MREIDTSKILETPRLSLTPKQPAKMLYNKDGAGIRSFTTVEDTIKGTPRERQGVPLIANLNTKSLYKRHFATETMPRDIQLIHISARRESIGSIKCSCVLASS